MPVAAQPAAAPGAPPREGPSRTEPSGETPPTARTVRRPSALDRLMWAAVREIDEEAVLNFKLTAEESRRLHALKRKAEGGELPFEEAFELFKLKLATEAGGALAGAVFRKRGGWRGEWTDDGAAERAAAVEKYGPVY